MTITSLDGVIAGFQPPQFIAKATTATLVAGRPTTWWSLAGAPGAGAFNGTLNGVTLTAPQSGQIPFTNPVSGNAYLARFSGSVTQAGLLLLCDRLWHNGGFTITSTGAQTITSPTWPARDNSGTTNGDGVLLGVEVSATTGAGTPTLTVSYTNQVGTSGQTGTNTVATVATSAIGSFYPIGLAAGDTGVSSVQSLTLSATWTSGTINMVAYRIIIALEIPGAGIPNAVDALTGGMPIVWNGSVLFPIFVPNTTTASVLMGQMIITNG